MNKLIAALVAGLFATAVFAQDAATAPAATNAAPAAAPAEHAAPKSHKSTKHHGKKKKAHETMSDSGDAAAAPTAN